MTQGYAKGFESLGFKTQTLPLSHFREDYGLVGDGEEDEEEDDEEDDEMDGEPGSESSDEE